jgi:pimeloyl-ACP methyl ester carboxylesterase
MIRRAPLLRPSDLRGVARIATDATAGLTDLVEAMHERISRIPGVSSRSPDGRAGGISGLVYKTVRGITRIVGGSLDALLGLLGPLLGSDDLNPERETIVAALNGVLGDYLAVASNPLAVRMAFRHDGRPLTPEAFALTAPPQARRRLLVLVHGLCMNDLQWSRDGHDHGVALAHDLGFTRLPLHYNSGLHISINGRELAHQLERLIDAWPQPIERLVIIGHSMGGLVARSAVHYAALMRCRWPARLDDLVFLGTPHHGAPLERAGHWAEVVLGRTPYAAPFAGLGKVRSSGITDLRHGSLVDEDWVGRDRFERAPDRRQHVPLPDGVRCYAMAASLGKRVGNRKSRLPGDGLVPVNSALGRHRDPARTLAFARDRHRVGYSTSHLALLSNARVYARLRRWLDHAAEIPRARDRR